MGLRDRFSNFVYRQLEKRGIVEDVLNNSIRYGSRWITSDNVLESSDVYELVSDISNQVALATPVVIGPDEQEIRNHAVLRILNQPNNYLTGFELMKLQVIKLLIDGEVFPISDNDQIHLAPAETVYTEIDNRLVEHFKINGNEIPPFMIRHIKNMGTSHNGGVGIKNLAKNTLEGVMNAEKSLTDKYVKGGLLALLLKLDTHLNPQNNTQSKLITRILNQLEGINEQHSVKMIPLGKGYEIETLASPVDDDKILRYLSVYKKDLGKFMGINVDTYQSLMKTDIEKAMMYLHNKTVKPILKNLSEHYSALFFEPKSGYRVEWKINILDFVPYSTKTNIGYNIVRTGITSPDNVAEMLGFPKQNTPETQAIYISNDLSRIGQKNATDDSLSGSDKNQNHNLKGGEKDEENAD